MERAQRPGRDDATRATTLTACSRRAASSIAGRAGARRVTRYRQTTTASRAVCSACARSTTRTRSTSSARCPCVAERGAPVPAQHRAAARLLDAPRRLHGTRRNDRRRRRPRNGRRGRSAHRAAGPFHPAQCRPRRPGAPVLSGSLARHRFRAGPGDDRGAAVSRKPTCRGTRSPFGPPGERSKLFFADRRAGAFAFHAADIA